jgi:hypothetical protein
VEESDGGPGWVGSASWVIHHRHRTHRNDSDSTRVLPIAEGDDELYDSLQPHLIVLVEATHRYTIQIQHAKNRLRPAHAQDERTDDLALRLAVTGNVARVLCDVRYEHGRALEEGVGADASSLPRAGADVDVLAGGFAAEGA